jgi:protein farnesyltransferase subunit beta
MFCFDRCSFDDEDIPTITSEEQIKTEDVIVRTFEAWRNRYQAQQRQANDPSSFHPLTSPPDMRILRRDEHIKFLLHSIKVLPANFHSLACIHPWVTYWTLQSLALLDVTPILSPEERKLAEEQANGDGNSTNNPVVNTIWTREFGLEMISFISKFQHPTMGGYAGQFGGMPHIITTYAAVMSLVIVGTRCGCYDVAYKSINIDNLLSFYESMKVKSPSDENYGSFQTTLDGEIDTRAVFACVSVMDILGLLPNQTLTKNTAAWLAKCQNYDGGFSSEPGVESHGGYTFTSLSALVSLEACDTIDLDALEKWCVTKQLEREGGFCGRTHKLVDSCYSFWVGSTISLIHVARQQLLDSQLGRVVPTLSFNLEKKKFSQNNESTQTAQITAVSAPSLLSHNTCQQHDARSNTILPPEQLGWLFDQQALQCYITLICQAGSGFKDKPGKPIDLYHTCYSLSGLASSQVSIPYQKLSYVYINQTNSTPSPTSQLTPTKLDSPSPSSQSPLLTEMENKVMEKHQREKSEKGDGEYLDLNPLKPQVSIDDNSSAGINVIEIERSVAQLVDKFKHPVVYRFGGPSSKLQPNNLIYNLPQACYSIAHAYQVGLRDGKNRE